MLGVIVVVAPGPLVDREAPEGGVLVLDTFQPLGGALAVGVQPAARRNTAESNQLRTIFIICQYNFTRSATAY